ncbi:dihydrodipicolinate synthase family protein [bacterium]|nr:MAG: dihydrodipicolinate synthase family protein [bacterium]
MTESLQLSGAIPANIMPFRADYSIDEGEYRRHLDWLASVPGVGGITCNGHAAEVSVLTRKERQWAAAVAVATVNHRVPVVAGIYAESYRQAIDLALDVKAEGVDALLIFPLNALLLGGDHEMVYRHYAEIASAVGLPMVLFMYPAWTRMQYGEELLQRLLTDIPLIVAVKEWSLDIGVYERNLRVLRSLDRHVAMLTSHSTNLLPSLALGADGILSGHGSVICDLQAQLLRAAGSGRREEAAVLYDRIQGLTRVVYRDPLGDMYTRMKEQLVMLGRLREAVSRPPLLPISDVERGELRDALRKAGLLAADAAGVGSKR